MIDSFVRMESYFLERFRDKLFFTPVDIPILIFSLTVVAIQKCTLDAVLEIGFKFDFRTKLAAMITDEEGSALFLYIFESTLTFY